MAVGQCQLPINVTFNCERCLRDERRKRSENMRTSGRNRYKRAVRAIRNYDLLGDLCSSSQILLLFLELNPCFSCGEFSSWYLFLEQLVNFFVAPPSDFRYSEENCDPSGDSKPEEQISYASQYDKWLTIAMKAYRS